MQFLVIGKDGTDADAPNRRAKTRQDHIAMDEQLLECGNLWYGAALTGENGETIGSAYMVDFKDKNELNKWLEKEPYKIGDVWKEIKILPCNTRDPWQFNRPKEFFESRK